MLYSDLKLYLAGVKVPYQSCVSTASNAQAVCVFFVPEDDRAKQEASILARIKYEGVPVTIIGTDYKKVSTVLLDGVSSSMNIRYDPDQGLLTLSITAISRLLAALSGIRYNELSMGSVYASAESAVAASVSRQINEATGNVKTVVAAPTPVTSLNSIIFMEKLITGTTRTRVKCPSDIIEFSIDNILKAQNIQTSSTRNLKEVLAFSSSDMKTAITSPARKAMDSFMGKCYALPAGSPVEELITWYKSDGITAVTPELLKNDPVLSDFLAEQADAFPDTDNSSVDLLTYCKKVQDTSLKKLNVNTWRNYSGALGYSRPQASVLSDKKIFPEYGIITCALADIFVQVAECLAVIKNNNSFAFLKFCIDNSQTEVAFRVADLFRKHLNN